MSDMAPHVHLAHLDHLWFQVTGTRCNLTCRHCFISCSPHNQTFGFLSLEEVLRRLDESLPLGVKEYYFTGGEPFLHPDLVPMLVATLRYGPATVLTNATVLNDRWLSTLRDAEAAGPYSLEFRVSIDGFSPETNDPLRGAGTWERALQGIRRLVGFGFMPIITATQTWPDGAQAEVVDQFVRALKQYGYSRPRLKILPLLRLGAELQRTSGYDPQDRVTAEMLADFDDSQLVCEHSRIVTDQGVHVCPILIEQPDAWLGTRLVDAQVPAVLRHGACWTCYQYGAICSNPSSATATRSGA